MNNTKKARFISRAVAYFIDIVIVSLLAVFLSFPFVSKYDDDIVKIEESSNEIRNQFINGEINMENYLSESSFLIYQETKYNGSLILLTAFVELMYFVVYQMKNNGRTIGKKIMKIHVVSQDGELSYNQVIIRSFMAGYVLLGLLNVFIVSVIIDPVKYVYLYGSLELLIFIIVFISVFMILYGKERRGLHDLVAKTDVIVD